MALHLVASAASSFRGACRPRCGSRGGSTCVATACTSAAVTFWYSASCRLTWRQSPRMHGGVADGVRLVVRRLAAEDEAGDELVLRLVELRRRRPAACLQALDLLGRALLALLDLCPCCRIEKKKKTPGVLEDHRVWPPAWTRDLLVVDQLAVEARALAGGEDVARHLQGVEIRVARLRHVVGEHHGGQRRVRRRSRTARRSAVCAGSWRDLARDRLAPWGWGRSTSRPTASTCAGSKSPRPPAWRCWARSRGCGSRARPGSWRRRGRPCCRWGGCGRGGW